MPSSAPPLSAASVRVPSSVIRDLLRIAESPEILSLAGGLPAPECLPAERVRMAADRALSVIGRCGPTALQYGPTEGLDALRETVAPGTLASPALGRAEQVIITTGSQQGLALVAHALVDPGTVVVVEDPAYLGAHQVFAGHGADLVGIPVDADGLDTDDLAHRLSHGLRPAVVSCVPNFSNPSGACLSLPRRVHLAALAQRYGFVIVEDDPYHALSFCGPPPPSIGHFAPDQTVSLGSASKVIAPGLRVGWLHAPAWLVAPIVRAKQTLDLHTPTLNQLIVAEILNDSTFSATISSSLGTCTRGAPGRCTQPSVISSMRPSRAAECSSGVGPRWRPHGSWIVPSPREWRTSPGPPSSSATGAIVGSGSASPLSTRRLSPRRRTACASRWPAIRPVPDRRRMCAKARIVRSCGRRQLP